MSTAWDTLATAPAYGLPAANFVPVDFRSQCTLIAQKHTPAGVDASFPEWCANMLIARGIMARHKVPGDCEYGGSVDFSDVQIAQGAGQIAGNIASMAGASIPGIGSAISLIANIFAHHDMAVANEQKVICQVAGVINQVIAYYDRQVKIGAVSPSAAYGGMQSFFQQCKAHLQSIYKSCNAACWYSAVLDAHADFVTTYYPYIAPVQAAAHAPGAAPSALGTVPGGVVQVGNAAVSTVTQAAAGLSSTEKFILLVLALGIGGLIAYKAAT
jgi:hypothetical protein